jgi:hypothetical protein
MHQPWASLVACGVKQVETRSWSTNYRGMLAIHASRSLPAYARRAIAGVEMQRALDECDLEPGILPTGAIIATVELVDVLPTMQVEGDLADREIALGDYSPGRYAWILAYPMMLDAPVPYRGFQGLWELPDEVLA